jgi:hypothetical protein
VAAFTKPIKDKGKEKKQQVIPIVPIPIVPIAIGIGTIGIGTAVASWTLGCMFKKF